MPRPTVRIQPRRFEERISNRGFFGINTFGPSTTLKPDEFLALTNFDIYESWIESRNGSFPINGQVAGSKFPDRSLLNGIVWDTGTAEYLILQINNAAIGPNASEFWSVKIDGTVQSPVQIALLGGGSFTIPETPPTRADLFISTDRLFVIHPSANKVIEWDGTSAFTGRPLGLPQPYITSVAALSTGLTGKYTYGIELVYQKLASVDQLASGANRQYVTTHIVNTITVVNQGVRVVADNTASAISGNTTWTHARLYRSKNQNIDYTDPTQPIDAQGTPEQLYSVVTVTRADFLAGTGPCPAALTFPTDSTTDANIPADAYYVEFDRIDLSPLPNAYVGAYHRNRIFVTRAQGISDIGQSNVYYSNNAGTKYCEQYAADQVIYCEPGDGQQSIKLISFEQDLIVLKEAKTGRVRDGNPDNGFEALDYNIGITDPRMARYIPKLGIAAIVNDRKDFRIFGYDLKWNSMFAGRNISMMARSFTAAADPTKVSFVYINGRLWVGVTDGSYLVLHVESGRGWTQYDVPNFQANPTITLPYAAGTKGLVVETGGVVVELDKSGATSDTKFDTATTTPISHTIHTWDFQKSGREHLEMRHLSIMAVLSDIAQGFILINGQESAGAPPTPFVVDPDSFPLVTSNRQRPFFLYVEDKPIGNYLACKFLTSAPCSIHDIVLDCFVDEAGWNDGGFDPKGEAAFGFIPFPTWASTVLVHLTFDEP